MRAYQLKRVDKEYDMHLQAWLNVQAGTTKESGGKTRPVYDSFKKFFDYKKRLKEIDKMDMGALKPKYSKMASAAVMANKGKEGEDGRTV